MKEIKEHYKSFIPKLFKAEAITFDNHIFYLRSKESVASRWKIHERVHVEQYRKFGVFLFLTLYMLQYLYNRLKGLNHFEAYRNISFEREAYEKEKL